MGMSVTTTIRLRINDLEFGGFEHQALPGRDPAFLPCQAQKTMSYAMHISLNVGPSRQEKQDVLGELYLAPTIDLAPVILC